MRVWVAYPTYTCPCRPQPTVSAGTFPTNPMSSQLIGVNTKFQMFCHVPRVTQWLTLFRV